MRTRRAGLLAQVRQLDAERGARGGAVWRLRRSVEVSGLVVGLLGLPAALGTEVFHQYLPPAAVASHGVYLGVFVPLCLAMAVTSGYALWMMPIRWYGRFSVARHTLDVAACVVVALTTPADARAASVCLMTMCVLAGAARFGLGGALATWVAAYGIGGTILATAAVLSADGTGDPTVRATVVGLGYGTPLALFAAVITGTRTRTADQNLEALERTQEALEHQATHDGLTGLANRAVLYRRAATLECAGAFLAIDLDGFKQVNDQYGHAAGDAVLRATAARLEAGVGAHDLAVRAGGDEFVVVLVDADAHRAEAVASALRTDLARPVAFGNALLTVGASIGTALAAAGRPWDIDALSTAADARMYQVKRARRSTTTTVHEPADGFAAEARL